MPSSIFIGGQSMIVRLCKIAIVMAVALFFTLIAFGNITDYDSNWLFVRHVLSMDTTFLASSLRWRAITSPALQAAGYWLIIATQVVTAVLLWAGAFRLLNARRGPEFARAKDLAVAGLTLGFLLYAVGFVDVGGEWFAMWQSPVWNGQQKAFNFIAMAGIALIVVLLPDREAAE
jgi:predicted small integral membrane protein